MRRIPPRDFLSHRRLAFTLLGILVTCAVVLPACTGGDTTTPGPGTTTSDLSVTKTGVVSDHVITYTVTVTNLGSTSEGPVTVIDSLTAAPTGTTFTAASGASCNLVATGPIQCDITSVGAGASVALTIEVTVPAPAGGDVENCAVIGMNPPDPNALNNVSCTTNTVTAPLPSTGSITIVKDAQPDDPQNFSFTSGDPNIPGFTLDDDADPTLSNTQVISGLAAGTYTFTEQAVNGWTLAGITCDPAASGSLTTIAGQIEITLGAGENVTCTYVNTLDAPTTGSITIVKDAQPDDPQNFSFTTDNANIPDFLLDDDADPTLSNTATFSGLEPGTYTFLEAQVSGWNVASIDCSPSSNAALTPVVGQVAITIAAGDDVTCTYVNAKVLPATITITKDAQPDGPQDFTFTTDNAAIPGFSLDDDADPTLPNTITFTDLEPGTYTFLEAQVSGWNVASIDCSPSSNAALTPVVGQVAITVAAGDSVGCTYTNATAATTGSITIVKDAQPDDAQDFHFSRGAGSPGFTLDDDADPTLSNTRTFDNLAPGSYSFTEDELKGWTLSTVNCNPLSGTAPTVAGDGVDITLVAGADITCTFVNVQNSSGNGRINVILDAQPDDPQDFHFTATGTGLSDFDLDDDADGSLPNSKSFAVPQSANYSFQVGSVTGWTISSIQCSTTFNAVISTDPSAGTFNINGLGAGEVVTCTVTVIK